MSFWNAFSLPAAAALRISDRLLRRTPRASFPRVSQPLNRTLIALGRIERRIMRVAPLPVGLSLIGVLKP